MNASLHQTLLMVRDLDASVEFYRDVVGIETAEESDTNVEFDTGDATLVLESDFGPEVLDAFGLDEPGEERGRGVIVAVDVGDPDAVDAVEDRAVDAGADVRMGPRDVDWGRRMMLVADPDGYTVEVSAPR